MSTLIKATKANDIVRVRELLNEGCNLNLTNRGGRTALHIASESGQVEIVDLLLSAGTDHTIVDEYRALTII